MNTYASVTTEWQLADVVSSDITNSHQSSSSTEWPHTEYEYQLTSWV